MKLQDIAFACVLVIFVLSKRNPKWFIVAGLGSFILSMPLFHFWVFFTAERLVWYALAFLLVGSILLLRKN